MNSVRILTASLVCLVVFTTACTKTETIIKTEIKTDTVQVAARDTTFIMDVSAWNLFEYSNLTFLSSGPTTYTNTTEGIKFFGQSYRYGSRLQVKNEVAFRDKTMLFKWKANGAGQFCNIVLTVKYIPTSNDAYPELQGVDVASFSTNNVYNGSIIIQHDTWYYTRITAQNGTYNYMAVTATGNYDSKGGTVVNTKSVTLPTTHGYPSIRIGDPYAGSAAYGILGECKIVTVY